MKLNIGSGYKRLDGYLNIDHDPLVNPDICINIDTETWPIPDNSIEEIRAHHILEHIGEGFLHVIKEIYRVSQNGTIIDIIVPHPRHDNYYGDPTHRRPITPLMLKQFSKKYCQNHKETHNSSSGFAPRLNVDLEIIDTTYSIDETYNPSEYTQEQIKELAHRFNNVYKDIYIKMIVLKD